MEKLFTDESASRPHSLLIVYQILAMVGGIGAIGKVALLPGVHGAVKTLVFLVLSAWIASALFWKTALRYRRLLAPIALLGLFAVPPLIFPHVEKMHAVGRGSDQPDCIVLVSDRLLDRQWPYDSSLVWSHNPLSCGPGWVALQAPFVRTFHYPWTVVLILFVSIAAIAVELGWENAAGFLSLLLLAPGLWIAVCDGTDFLTFGFCVAALSITAERSRWGSVLHTLILSLVTQFRVATLLLPATLGRSIGRRRAIAASVLAIATETAFLAWSPAKFIHDGPMHILSKSTGLDLSHGASTWLIALFVVFSAIATVATLWLAKKMSSAFLPLCYLLCIFAFPAFVNLLSGWRSYGLSLRTLGVWEGGNWMAGCMPLAALLLVIGDRAGLASGSTSESRDLRSEL